MTAKQVAQVRAPKEAEEWTNFLYDIKTLIKGLSTPDGTHPDVHAIWRKVDTAITKT